MLTQEREPRTDTIQTQESRPAPTAPITPTEAQPIMAPPAPEPPRRHRRIDATMAGIVLVVVGLLTLIGNIWNPVDAGLLIMPTLGVIFLAWGYMSRRYGFLVPGSILLGLGLGTFAQQTAFATQDGVVRGAIVTLGLALGFLAIMPLLAPHERHMPWWPAVPGGVLLIVGLTMLSGPGGLAVLQAIGPFWPIIPIVIGVYLIWLAYRRREPHSQR